ncbi:MAG: dTDP-4-dehydrorhamnose reductase [Desulfobulbaceae bacterium]|nr:dTDP-4-dehydrorhamnose reductase [Desulfobulbaceae bacterium]
MYRLLRAGTCAGHPLGRPRPPDRLAVAGGRRPAPLRQRRRRSRLQGCRGLPVKVLLTGARGQAGHELRRSAPPGAQLLCLDRQSLDITNPAAVLRTLAAERPALVINAAAYTAVDKAESEPEQAFAINASGTGNLAAAAAAVGARLLHISTDFVFDGSKSSPYQPEEQTNPVSVYGASKLAGEEAARAANPNTLIIRTGWLYGAHGQNFVKTILRLLGERAELAVIADQVGTPTWTGTLAEALWAAAARPELRGLYHWSDAGVASWYDFAFAIQEEALALGLLPRAIPITPITTAAYPTAARRPAYSVLDKTTAWRDFALAGQHWRVSLRRMLKEFIDHA